MIRGHVALVEVLDSLEKSSRILDIGSGEGQHAEEFHKAGHSITSIDLGGKAGLVGDYLQQIFTCKFDCIWCCHVLEHQRNVGAFLDKINSDLWEDGLLAITVPPRKDEIVGGHLSLWNPGLLLYNLIMAGFDCRDALVLVGGYDISCVLKKRTIDLPQLKMDNGDIDRLSEFFPVEAKEGFDGWLDG